MNLAAFVRHDRVDLDEILRFITNGTLDLDAIDPDRVAELFEVGMAAAGMAIAASPRPDITAGAAERLLMTQDAFLNSWRAAKPS